MKQNTFQIKVTKEILEKAKYCDGSKTPVGKSCAIALAIIELMPKAEVGTEYLYPLGFETGQERPIKLPDSAIKFIRNFDETHFAMRPFMPEIEFEIEIPDSTLELLIPIGEVEEHLKNSKTLKLVS